MKATKETILNTIFKELSDNINKIDKINISNICVSINDLFQEINFQNNDINRIYIINTSNWYILETESNRFEIDIKLFKKISLILSNIFNNPYVSFYYNNKNIIKSSQL